MNIFHRIIDKAGLRDIDLNDSKTFKYSFFVVPIFFGIVSLWLGADTNWDLQNYHLYNAFSLLKNKLHMDLAVAGMQTYFNPTLDVPYYLMTSYLPAPLVGFIMGALHGINFILLAGICYKALPNLPPDDRFRIPLLLSIFGCLTANFLSEIGSTMGDNTTSIFVLASLFIVLNDWDKFFERGIRPALIAILAGSCLGLGAGLKLTNVVYAAALCASFFVVPVSWTIRFRVAFLFGLGVLIGMAATSGYWFYEMWRSFGNPLFPQFSAFFANPLTHAVAVVDVVFRPKNGFETVFWPFVFSLKSERAAQLPGIHQIIWPVVYILFWCWIVIALVKNKDPNIRNGMRPSSKYIVAVVAIGYLIWMKLFSIQRYLVPIEICAPLVAFILLMRLTHYQKARKIAIWVLAISSAIVLLGGVHTWGHASWSEKMFRVDLPPLDAPEKTTVLQAGGDPPFGWIAAQFPASVAFAQVHGSFPEAMPEYSNRIHAMVKERGGPVFAIVQGTNQSSRIAQIAKIRETASRLGITSSEKGCAALQWASVHLKLHASVTVLDHSLSEAKCSIDVLSSDIVDVAAKNRVFVSVAAKQLAIYGYSIDSAYCKPYSAYMGKDESPFQWCKLSQLQ
jgi:hypothetical protein